MPPAAPPPAADPRLSALGQLLARPDRHDATLRATAFWGGLLAAGVAAGQLAARGRLTDALGPAATPLFLLTWTGVFGLTGLLGAALFWRAARRAGRPFFSPVAGLVAGTVLPAAAAGLMIGDCVALTSHQAILPVLFWLVFYGLALLAAKNFAPPALETLGWAFLLTGLGAFAYFLNQTLVPELDLPLPASSWPPALMGLSFGGYHLLYGLTGRRRRHRGAVPGGVAAAGGAAGPGAPVAGGGASVPPASTANGRRPAGSPP